MKLHRAFTLAEVLIAVAIVGVVAALTVPSMATKIDSETNMAKLSKSVTLIQNGMGEIFQQVQNHSEEGMAASRLTSIQVKDLFETAPDGASSDDYIADGQKLFALTGGITGLQTTNNYNTGDIKNTGGITGLQTTNNYNTGDIKNYDGTNVNNNLLTNCSTYQFNKNTSVVILQDISANDENEDKVIAKVFIDVNGAAVPNRIGIDVFLFGLSNNGILVPAGSEKYNDNTFSDSVNSYTTDCQNNITTGLSCAARVMADGWKIKY